MNYLAVLVSGNGTNLQAIIDAIEAGRLQNTHISVVVSNRKSAYALQRAERHGIPTLYHAFGPYRERAGTRARQRYDEDLAKMMASFPVDLVVLAGWMHVLSMTFLKHYPGRVVNIHPALPGMFPGTHAIERAYDAFQRGEIDHTGVMVHYVPDEGVDSGPVIVQREVPILPSDTIDDLEARIHRVEHEIYVQAIAQALEHVTTIA
ncbi:MAG: phosphoribosylglycinamide formyltransferase [Anaerolineae bacterium]|nr:phosphoribosylglycinamide formyltransferase [Anaerolineae bacterium]